MAYYDEQLKKLSEQIARKKHLDSQLTELRRQQRMLEQSIRALKATASAEQEDVQKLEGCSLATIYYRITGKLDEKLTQERQEAYAAAIKYDSAVKELTSVEEDIRRCESELTDLFGCELRYELTLKEKAQMIKDSGSPEAQEILRMEKQIADLENRKKELNEAIYAGKAALSQAKSVLSCLNSADAWNTWDMVGGGGIITHVAKHGHLDEAQAQVYSLQNALRRFKTELVDVSTQADIQVSIDGFLRFADYFFDGLLADWAVRDRIQQSRSQVEGVVYKIQWVIDAVKKSYDVTQREQDQKKEALNTWILAQRD